MPPDAPDARKTTSEPPGWKDLLSSLQTLIALLTREQALAVDAKRLAALIGIGLRTVRTLDAAGQLPRAIPLGGRKLWYVDEIRDWLAAGAPDRVTWEARHRPAKRS
jgi:predicted DNA-binding transcriptional regulator AlpA